MTIKTTLRVILTVTTTLSVILTIKTIFLGSQTREMLYAQSVELAKNVAYPLNLPPSSQATRLHSGKARSYESIKSLGWNNAVYEKKEKSHYFIHPAQDTTNSFSNFNQRERMGSWEIKGDPHWEQEKVKKGNKAN